MLALLVAAAVPGHAADPVARLPTQPVIVRVVDSEDDTPLPVRVYLRDESGGARFVESIDSDGTAVRYEKRNWINPRSEEFHTTVSAHPFRADLPAGRHELVIERGKEYFPATNTIVVSDEPVSLEVKLKRWINLAERGWFSGDTHVHRTPDELPNVMLAEDLNVAFPLTYWVTRAFQPPSRGDKNVSGILPEELVTIDATHVFWPRNTEWEIFTVGSQRHTLGAVFALGHREPFELGVPTVREIAAEARRRGALLDLDKHDWPWSMTLPPNMDVRLYELSNNHVWRTEFAFTAWNSPTPPWLRPPLKESSGNEREWLHFTFANYYALLNHGLNLVPTAGTASGVHPVPLGFGRVYVNLPEGFDYEAWLQGLEAGRSFVTTGPMLFATVNGQLPGARFSVDSAGFDGVIEGEIIGEQPLSFAEVIHDGRPVHTVMAVNERTESGAYRTAFRAETKLNSSGWLAVRAWENRPHGRVRFAHTAPWQVNVEGRPLLPRREERDYLVERVQLEIDRSRDVLPESALREYEDALNFYRSKKVRADDDASQRRPPANETALDDWLNNMRAHGYTATEMSDVLDLPVEEITTRLTESPEPSEVVGDRVRVLPHPGGRHPRLGFFEGAIAPQRDTKVSVFTPWDPTSYVVIDLPEAIWSNLGLTYLAHTHIDTLWDRRGETLPPLEWSHLPDGSLQHERVLPNGIGFGAKVTPRANGVDMELWLHNGTDERLTGLKVQNCVMLKAAEGFSAQSNGNKRLETPFAAAVSEDGQRWIVTAWERCDRVWANPPVPCVHSDPAFPDLNPGETGRVRGRLWFHEGADPRPEWERLRREFTNATDTGDSTR